MPMNLFATSLGDFTIGSLFPPLPLKKFCYPLVTSSLKQSFEQSTKTRPEQGNLGNQKKNTATFESPGPISEIKLKKETAGEFYQSFILQQFPLEFYLIRGQDSHI